MIRNSTALFLMAALAAGLSSRSVTHMAVSGSRLFVISSSIAGGWGFINIWNGAPNTASPRPPDVTLAFGSNLESTVQFQIKGDTLVACVSDPPQTDKVNIYSGASTLSAETLTDFEIRHATLSSIRMAVLASDGRLYVLDGDGVSVFRDALTSPVFVCEIATGVSGPTDMLLLE